jgi:hypothetical protein
MLRLVEECRKYLRYHVPPGLHKKWHIYIYMCVCVCMYMYIKIVFIEDDYMEYVATFCA